jgi:NAD(P)-dependent dehydrogenase (short-subunit alcohol dehydrogenase family)
MQLPEGTVVLVTGAARGLGWGIARAFGQAGARVAATDINDVELARCAGDLADDGATHLTFRSDVADLADCQRVVDAVVTTWGRLDVIVHNAIYMPLLRFEATTPDEWRRQLSVGLDGMFHLAHAAWNQLRAQGGGHLIGIASGSSFRGFKEEIAYCAIKHGVEGFVKALSFEAAEHNIAINTMGPGAPIKPTRMTWAEHEQAPEAERRRWADPVRLGRAFVWLAAQPPNRLNGYRLDAGAIVDTLEREGPDFDLTPEKITHYPNDFRARQEWYDHYPE